MTEFHSLEKLVGDSVLVVVAMGTGASSRDPNFGDKDVPLGIIEMKAETVLKGEVDEGSTFGVSVEGGFDNETGNFESQKLNTKDTYLLFLRSQGEEYPSTFTVTGYLAGLYLKTSQSAFGKLDFESPDLPESVTEEQVYSVIREAR